MQKRNTLDPKKEDRQETGKSDVMASEGKYRWTVSAAIVLLLAISAAHVTNKPACKCGLNIFWMSMLLSICSILYIKHIFVDDFICLFRLFSRLSS